MRIDYLASDILLFHGDSLSSLATAFIDGPRVLLVDALASVDDAQAMRAYLEDELGKRVEMLVLTHAEADHTAGVMLFPQAEVIVQPRTLQWGRHALDIFSNPGQTADTLGIEVAGADLLFVADNIVGNIAYLGAAAPEAVDAALLRLQARGRSRIVPGHMGVQDASALANARHYLARLRERVGALRAKLGEQAASKAISEIDIEELLAPRVHASRFERHWHKQNLARVNERALFPAAPAAARGASLCRRGCETVLGTLRQMLGGLARQGL
jgi:glyoxylase-like metal-dependent hydrolase (beta-lactamase superfamily II)